MCCQFQSWPPGSGIAGKDFGLSVAADQKHFIGFAFGFRPVTRGALGHPGHHKPDGVRAKVEQMANVGNRNMLLDHVAVDPAGLAEYHLLWDAVVEFIADKESSHARLGSHIEPFRLQNQDSCRAASAFGVLEDVNRGPDFSHRGDHGCDRGSTSQKHKSAARDLGQYENTSFVGSVLLRNSLRDGSFSH
ncbi:MAG: hypothetical protein ACI9LZ_003566 [Glaciecola sp.]|jgi:hypothetical protein